MPHEPLDSIADWLDVRDAGGLQLSEDQWWQQRLERQHALQVAVDVIAYAHNMPLRLLRRKNLVALDQTFVSLVQGKTPHNRAGWKQHFQTMLQSHGPSPAREAAGKSIDELENPGHVLLLRDWILSLATDSPKARPEALPPFYENWFLDLLPHLERDVWLTEMGNPHPAHGMARMVEHWSLYVLLSAWAAEPKFGSKAPSALAIPQVMGMERLSAATRFGYARHGRGESQHDVWMLGGPFELEILEPRQADLLNPREHWFIKVFQRFIDNVSSHWPWQDVRDKAPNAEQLLDAFATRLPMDKDEANRRLDACWAALEVFRKALLHPSVWTWSDGSTTRPISRANWESIAALSCWLSRWRPRLTEMLAPARLHVRIPGHRMSLLVDRDGASNGNDAHSRRVRVLDEDVCRDVPADSVDAEQWIESVNASDRSTWIETPAAFLARARERQHALWASQVVAIGGILSRHSRRDRPVGPSQVSEHDRATFDLECDAEDHLLRGYASRVCQYLLQMARADVAFICWLDYSADPPLLRHVGGADRLVQHRAQRRKRFKRFTAWSREPQEGTSGTPQTMGEQSASQLYRAISRADIEPDNEALLAESRQKHPAVNSYFEHYAAPGPKDSIAVPLLVNERVIGVFSVSGVSSPNQFDRRLRAPLRLVAQQLAQAMAVQSQLWHMRQLNWLASHRPPDHWRQHDVDNQYNPLEPVARTLANLLPAPVVHIWLRDPQNQQRFKLHGYTRPDLLAKPPARLNAAPQFEIADVTREVDLSRQFSAFAIEQRKAREAGSFVQAMFDPDASKTNYTLEQAERGSMRLGKDFIEADAAPAIRQAIFVEAKLRACMSFALVDSSVDEEPIGAVSLYAPLPTRHGTSPPWPAGWRPVVAHLQTYLPYVLMQTEAVANPLYQMRRYLLHEGRNELNGVAGMSGELSRSLNQFLAVNAPPGRLRPWLARSLPKLNELLRGEIDPAAARAWLVEAEVELTAADKQLRTARIESNRLLSGEMSENLSLLARLIDSQRDLPMLGDPTTSRDFDHETEWFAPKALLRASFDSYNATWRSRNTKPYLDDLPEDLELLTSPPLWQLMVRDLVHNIAKYALRHEPIKVVWARGSRDGERSTLRLSNFASYDAELDRADRLGKYGVQGSAGINQSKVASTAVPGLPGVMRRGQGIGLWGAKTIAKVLDMAIDLEVLPRQDKRSARYVVSISIPKRLVRGDRQDRSGDLST